MEPEQLGAGYVAFNIETATNMAACIAERHITGRATEEIKVDGYRLQAMKCKGKVTLYSRRKNILNQKFDLVAEALDFLPDETVIDHHLCPGTTTLSAGGLELGTVTCNCPCHKKPKIEVPQ
jgi:hypothetical protein